MLGSSPEPLCAAYDLAMLDLDGVVYVGGDAVPGAAEHLAAARAAGMRLAFITNNASRPPDRGGRAPDRARRAGRAARTSSPRRRPPPAAARPARARRAGWSCSAAGARGGAAARPAWCRSGSTTRRRVALVTGYGPEVLWRDVMRAAVRVRDGLWWVASNTDLTIPTSLRRRARARRAGRDPAPRSPGSSPLVAGKPARPLLDETVRAGGRRRPLMVGDRLDTDIEGAPNAGIDSLLVLTGVTGLAELVAATPGGAADLPRGGPRRPAGGAPGAGRADGRAATPREAGRRGARTAGSR